MSSVWRFLSWPLRRRASRNREIPPGEVIATDSEIQRLRFRDLWSGLVGVLNLKRRRVPEQQEGEEMREEV